MTTAARNPKAETKPRAEWDFAGEENRGFHEAADIFPEMSKEEFDSFKDDIAENGLQTPIVTLLDGRIIDGRHRWRACMETKTPPRYIIYRGNPWNYVISANLHRRHLNASQRAMVVARIADRPRGGQPGNANARRNPGNGESSHDQLPPTQTKAADMLAVGHSSVTQARRVMKHGTPEIAALVDDGLVKVNTAARVSAMGEDVQREFVRRVRSGEKPTDVAPIQGRAYTNGNGKRVLKHPSVAIFTKLNAEALSSGLVGIEMAFAEVTSVDKAVTREMASSLGARIRATKTVLNRLQRLLLEVAKEG